MIEAKGTATGAAQSESNRAVDLSATLELLISLTGYAEAGAIQLHLMSQAARHALDVHGDQLAVLVAVTRMYLAADNRSEATPVLERARVLAPEDADVLELIALMQTPPAAAEITGTSAKARRRTWKPSVGSFVKSGAEVAGNAIDRVNVARLPAIGSPVAEAVAALHREQELSQVEGEPHETATMLPSDPSIEIVHRIVPPPLPTPSPAVEPPPKPTAAPDAAGAAPPARQRRSSDPHLTLLDPNDPSRWLERYELIGELAAGGMARVYLARLGGVAGFQRFFGIKCLHPHLAKEQEFINMFLDEARLAAGLHHPNVVSIQEIGSASGGYYLVMDYIEGDSLSGLIARARGTGGLPRPIALRIVLDALQGLHAAHELSDDEGNLLDLVHRDCSPQNILVGLDGTSRLTDFGIARASSRLSSTRNSTIKGKLAYLSPEQAMGKPLDRRSDLFAMGTVLWEVLAGQRLFRAENDGATLSRILFEPIPSLAAIVPDLPTGVVEAVARALKREPAERFATAAEMVEAIEHGIRVAKTLTTYIASARDVAAYMRDVMGAELAARREAVRAWLARSNEDSDAKDAVEKTPDPASSISTSAAFNRIVRKE